VNDNSSFLDIVNLHKSFHVSKSFFSKSGLRLKAVNDVSLCVKQGETFGLVGESGCGKSTLARLILCLDKPDKGEICFKGKNIFSLKGP
jgi:ABC-type oligopeptide transport system ATPase subunit